MLSAGQVDYHCSISCQGVIKNSSRLSCFALIPSVPPFDSIKTDGTPWEMVSFITSFIFVSRTDDLHWTILCRSSNPEMSTHWYMVMEFPPRKTPRKRNVPWKLHIFGTVSFVATTLKARKSSSGGTLSIVNHLRFLILEMEELTVQIVLTEAKDGVEFRYLAKNGVLMSVLSFLLFEHNGGIWRIAAFMRSLPDASGPWVPRLVRGESSL